ncbi:hypothetical protein [Microcoleus sp. bin38.metabat.b11b12b14.051]|uniref:hypothetical protein n=1 Tax=Microcoleus sp. bin38.metabat.b11b12b14.051 TaxID=2742709 RepID=UPI0025D772AA|nr:hypothetical protein [Microcoleus sp. bin38.metabat.b11b12b14.051]
MQHNPRPNYIKYPPKTSTLRSPNIRGIVPFLDPFPIMTTSTDNFYLGDVASNFHFAGPLLDFEEEIQNQSPFHDLNYLTGEIKRGFLDYVRQGIMLDVIRKLRLYKDKFKTFKSYCEQALGRQYFYCTQIIKSAAICLRLIKAGFEILPSCVAQVVPLFKHAVTDQYGDSALQEKWQEVVDVIPKERITAITIAETVDNNPNLRLKQIRIKTDTYALLTKKAAAAGMSISEFLGRLVDEYNPRNLEQPTEHTPEQEEILDQLDAEFKKPAAEQSSNSGEDKVKSKGFKVKNEHKGGTREVKAKSLEGKVKAKGSESEIKLKNNQTEIPVEKLSNLLKEKNHEVICPKPNHASTETDGSSIDRDSVPTD